MRSMESTNQSKDDEGLTTTDKWLIGTLVPLGVIGISVGAYFFYKFKTKTQVIPEIDTASNSI